jgi:phosphoribosylformylglycinamidine synthase
MGSSRIAIVQFPGSNCDFDLFDVFSRHFGINALGVWHQEAILPKVDGVVLPGGFSYGDYLRSGALAAHSPIMQAVKGFADKGGWIMGICNGFQVLTESHLLPGALLRNSHRKFICREVSLAVGAGDSVYQKALPGKKLKMPVAHGEGRYYIDQEGLNKLHGEGRVAFRYAGENPNGAVDDIAGILSANGRVMGMMPHPERATDELVGGSADGLQILKAFLSSFL